MQNDAKWRSAARMLAFATASACACALTALAIVRGLDAAGMPEPEVALDGMRVQFKIIDILATWSPPIPERRIAFLGDSTSMNYPDGARGIDHQLGAALDALAPQGPRSRVFSLAAPGYSQFTQYFIAHRIAYTRPDAVVLAFNLASFSQQWRTTDRVELAAWLPARHLLEALTLPLHWIGLSTDELLLYTLVIRAGGFETWRWLLHQQARCVRGWTSLAEWLQARSGAPNGLGYRYLHFQSRNRAQHDPGPPVREREALVRARLGPLAAGVGSDHPVLRVLRATLEVFRKREIPVYVYIAPMNVEHFDRIGVRVREGLHQGVESVRRVVLAGGASLIDVHDLLPDTAFRDGDGHLVANESVDAPAIVARRIAQEMLATNGAR